MAAGGIWHGRCGEVPAPGRRVLRTVPVPEDGSGPELGGQVGRWEGNRVPCAGRAGHTCRRNRRWWLL